MSGLYLDAYSGISGDMFLGVLLDLGVPIEHLTAQLDLLSLPGWRLETETVAQQAVRGTRVRVVLAEEDHAHRRLSDIRRILDQPRLDVAIRSDALAVFELLAAAEAKVHGTSVEEVHFHEVGAVDAIVDIAGACVGLAYLGVRSFGCSPLPLGTGFVRSAHGLLPVPAPATLEILTACGAPVLPGAGEGEMVTPTGAAIVAHFGRFGAGSPLVGKRVGYGFGTRELPWPNTLRAILTSEAHTGGYETDTVTLLECNLDDMSGEVVPYVLERLLDRGALDAWYTPIGMKKGRPAVTLHALAVADDEGRLADVFLRETTTLGVRSAPWSRVKAKREIRTVDTPWGSVRVKLKVLDDGVAEPAPEYEDCARLAHEHRVPLRQVYAAALAAARE